MLRARLAVGIHRIGQVVQGAAALPLTAGAAREFMAMNYRAAAPRTDSQADQIVAMGLMLRERQWLEAAGKLPNRRVLVLGSGVGREAIALAKLGFWVTAVDFVASTLALLGRQAEKHNVCVNRRRGDLKDVGRYGDGWGLIWSTWASYSAIQGRSHRLDFLRQSHDALAPGGRFLCRFIYKQSSSLWRGRLKAAVAATLFVNFDYEPGDRVYSVLEFQHVFQSVESLRGELAESPLEIVSFEPRDNDGAVMGRAV